MDRLSRDRMLDVWNKIKMQEHQEFMPKTFLDFYRAWNDNRAVYVDAGFVVLRFVFINSNVVMMHGYALDHRVVGKPNDKLFSLQAIMRMYDFHRVQCVVPCVLKGLCRLLENIGFEHEGVLRDYISDGTMYHDASMYSLIRR
jgi:hypothetical protein